MNTLITRSRLALLGALLVPALGLAACTDLSVDPFSAVTPENFYQTDIEVTAALSPVYSQLRPTLWAYHNLSQVSSDETIVPTRGGDWGDQGRWLSMHRQTWSPQLVDLNDAWNTSYQGVARANSLLRDLSAIEEIPNRDGLLAEIRSLRAFYYYTLLDLFGNIPLIGDEPDEFAVDPDNLPQTETRATVFNFIVSELEAVRGDLPVAGAGNGGRFSQGAVDALLANLYINAPVFSGTVTTSGLQPGAPKYAEAAAAASRVISGPYSLNQGIDAWVGQFSPNNQNNPEAVFVVQHLAVDGFGLNFPHRALHYNSFAGGGWNGFSTIAETFNAFDDADPRKAIFAAGQAINYETGAPINDRAGNPLIFTPDYPNGVDGAAGEGDGVRVLKFGYDVSQVNGNGGNDYPYFRLGEMYLIRAEANLRAGTNVGASPLSDVNMLRARVGAPALTGLDLDGLLNERLYELTYEARRRQDLIRYGQFTDAWAFKSATEPYRILFPVPQIQIDASDGTLQQNAGY